MGWMLLLPEPPAHAGAFCSPPGMLEQQLLELCHRWHERGGAQPAPLNPHFGLIAAGHEVRAGLGAVAPCYHLSLGRVRLAASKETGRGAGSKARRSTPRSLPSTQLWSGEIPGAGTQGGGQLGRTKPHTPSAPSFNALISFPPVLCCTPQILLHLLGCPQAAGRCGCLNRSSLTICWEI